MLSDCSIPFLLGALQQSDVLVAFGFYFLDGRRATTSSRSWSSSVASRFRSGAAAASAARYALARMAVSRPGTTSGRPE